MSDIDQKEAVGLWDSANPIETAPEGYAGDNDYKLKSIEIESPSGS